MPNEPLKVARGPLFAGIALVGALAVGGLTLFANSNKSKPVSSAAVAANASSQKGPNAGKPSSLKLANLDTLSEKDREQFGKLVRDYLLKNPEIIMEVQRELEAKMEREQAARIKTALAKHKDGLTNPKLNLVAGNPDGDVTVVEFFDYNCGFCRRAVDAMSRLIDGDKKVRLVLQEMPIFGKESEDAARMAIAARKQGKYWELHAGLLKAKGRASGPAALQIAEKLGLDVEKLKKDAASDETTKFIRKAQGLGRSLGIQGTPHFFVGDQMIAGAPEDLFGQLRAKIAAERVRQKKG